MLNQEPITIMIHDLNPSRGQDRSMLEIAWQLNKEFPLEIHSYSLQGYDNWPAMEHIQYETLIKKPLLFKHLSYHYKTWQTLKKNKNQWIQSTGTASLKSHIVQVQFIHHAWLKIAENLPIDTSQEISLFKSFYTHFLNRYKLKMEQLTYTPQKNYIAISHSIKKDLMEFFNIPSQNIEIIHHGVDDHFFYPFKEQQVAIDARKRIREELHLKETDQVLLHIGSLNSRKGLFKTAQVLSFLKKNGFSNLKLLAVNSGDLKILESIKKEFQLENEIILASHNKDLRDYYWASDIFFFPTFYEPFGLVALEAMACGLPVVASSLSGVAELITHQENGLLFNPNHSIPEIANILSLVLRDKNLYDRLSLGGRNVAKKRSWTQVGKEYQDFYKRLRS